MLFSNFRNDSGTGEGAAVRTHEEAGAEEFLPADEDGQIRALAVDGVEGLLEASHVLGSVLGADDARAVHGKAFEHGQGNLVGKGRDVVDDVDGGLGGEFTEVGLDAFLGELVVVGADDGCRAAADVCAVDAHFQHEFDVGLCGTPRMGRPLAFSLTMRTTVRRSL